MFASRFLLCVTEVQLFWGLSETVKSISEFPAKRQGAGLCIHHHLLAIGWSLLENGCVCTSTITNILFSSDVLFKFFILRDERNPLPHVAEGLSSFPFKHLGAMAFADSFSSSLAIGCQLVYLVVVTHCIRACNVTV